VLQSGDFTSLRLPFAFFGILSAMAILQQLTERAKMIA